MDAALTNKILPPEMKQTRTEKLREARLSLGLKRREVYAHDDDWPELRELAKRLRQARERRERNK